MQMALPVKAFETIPQGRVNPTRILCKKRKECGTSNFHGKSLRGQLSQWYHPALLCVKIQNSGELWRAKDRPPARKRRKGLGGTVRLRCL